MATELAVKPFIFSRLPAELLYEIFGHAVRSGDRMTILALSCVSSWLRKFAEPYLYHTVFLCTTRSLRAFATMLDLKPAGFAAKHVKNLCISAKGPIETVDQALAACTGAESLIFGFSMFDYHYVSDGLVIPTLTSVREQHLTNLSLRDGWDDGLIAPNVTHLRLLVTDKQQFLNPRSGHSSWERLASITTLTHLAIAFTPSSWYPVTAMLPSLLEVYDASDRRARAAPVSAPKLTLVVIQVNDRSTDASQVDELNRVAVAQGGNALRVVAESMYKYGDQCPWSYSARGGKTIWEDAEAVLHTRLTKHEERD